MLTEQRKQLLLEIVRKDGRVIAKQISRKLRLSEDTIRRDLRELSAEGKLMRVHGGALPISPTVGDMGLRRNLSGTEKQLLGRAAAAFISNGQTIFIDGGTTHMELVRAIPLEIKATVVTHSPTIAVAFEHHTNVNLILLGGVVFRSSMVAMGSEVVKQIDQIRFDLAFIGANGLHLTDGLTTGDFEEASIKRLLLEQSGEVFALITSDKIGTVASHRICQLSDLSKVFIPKKSGFSFPKSQRERVVCI